MVKLTNSQKAVLRTIEPNPFISLSEISRLTKSKTSTTAYTINRLKEMGVISIGAIIDYTQLGFENIGIFFSTWGAKEKTRKAFVKHLCKDPRVAWLGSLAGEYQFGLACLVKRVAEAHRLLEEAAEHCSISITNKLIAPRIAITIFNRGIFGKDKRTSIKLGGSKVLPNYSFLDQAIIEHTANNEFTSTKMLAKALGEPYTTVERHLKSLQEKGVINFKYFIDGETLGFDAFRLLIQVSNLDKDTREKIIDYAIENPFSTMFVETFGSWDYELEIEAESPEEALNVSTDINELLGNQVERIRIFAEIKDYKFSTMPPGRLDKI